LQDLIERKAVEQTGVIVPQQSDLFKQYTLVLKTLARQRPLVLLLDDFQWADAGSISLLFHLGREIAGCRIILLVAYRPTDLMLGYNHTGMPAAERENHPLESVINEFKRSLGDIEIVLDQQDGQNFSGELLDTEPNQLGADFREMFYQQTREYPLFTVELLRSMQERGDLIRDPYGRWIEGAALDWSILPKRVEAVIAERLRRLPQNLRAILETASIEGEVFTAGVIAAVQHMDEREIIQALSGELSKLHRLVRAERSAQPVGLQKPAGLILSQYRFGHILFQRYLVQNLDPVERAHLHAEVAAVIELLYAGSLEEVALQLAWHFQEAGLPGKAISYLQQAGERAVHLSAHQEAIVHFSRALELLPSLPDEPGRLQLELALQIGLASSTCAIKGYGDARVGQAFDRARSLCQQIGETAQLFPVQWLLARFYAARADFKTAFEIMSQLTDQAERLGDPTLLVIGHWGLGWYHFFEGNFNASWTNLRAVLDFYDPQQHHSLAFTFGEDPGVICCSLASVVLWELGYPDQARQLGQEAIRLAEQLSDPYSLAAALGQVSLLDAFRRDFVSSNMLAEQCVRISTQHGYLYWAAAGMVAQSLAQIETGQVEKGIENCHRGSASYQATGAEIGCRHQLAWLANAYGKVGRVDEGLALLAETLTEAERSGEGYYNAEIQRLMGDLLLKKAGTHQAEAEQRYWQAIETARRHSARSWELRAVLSLCRLWLSQGDPDKISRGQQLLLELYSWFTEGFDSPDLQDARQLLEQLA
jgi:predicted ATPase